MSEELDSPEEVKEETVTEEVLEDTSGTEESAETEATEGHEEEEQQNPLSMSDEAFNELELPPEKDEKVEEDKKKKPKADSTTFEDSDEPEEKEEEDVTEDTETESKILTPDDQLKAALAPLKAVGKTVKLDNIGELRKFAQMGIGYSQRMGELKPHLKLIKMLKNNDLLDEGKLSYLIDLDKKNPEAIASLVRESGLEPHEINTDNEAEYSPNTYTVSDKDIDLDTVLDEIQGTPSYSKTIDIIGNKWDSDSKAILTDNPATIKIINEHVQSGVYDQIMEVVDKQKLLGNLTGLSDYAAYKKVGDAMYAKSPSKTQATTTSNKPVNKQDGSKIKDRKKAASSTKSTPSKKQKFDFNPLSMSDEEFAEFDAKFG